MLKKIIAVSIISLLGFNALDAGTVTPVNNAGFFSKTMQKAGETRFIFGVGGGFDYLTKSKFSTSQVRYVTVPLNATKKDIEDAGKGDWLESPLSAAYPTKYKYQAYPEIELGLRYMPKDQYYIQVTGNWQFMNKKLQFADLNKVNIVDTSGIGSDFPEYTKTFLLKHQESKHDINPLVMNVIGYVEGADECKVVRLRSRASLNLSGGKFITKRLSIGIDLGLTMHEFSVNDSKKSTVGITAGINFEHFFNSRISMVGYTNYEFGTKKIDGARSIVRGVNFGGRIRCHF